MYQVRILWARIRPDPSLNGFVFDRIRVPLDSDSVGSESQWIWTRSNPNPIGFGFDRIRTHVYKDILILKCEKKTIYSGKELSVSELRKVTEISKDGGA